MAIASTPQPLKKTLSRVLMHFKSIIFTAIYYIAMMNPALPKTFWATYKRITKKAPLTASAPATGRHPAFKQQILQPTKTGGNHFDFTAPNTAR